MRFLNQNDRREWAEEVLDLAMAAADRIAEVKRRAEDSERLLRGTLERQQIELRDLKRQLEGREDDGA